MLEMTMEALVMHLAVAVVVTGINLATLVVLVNQIGRLTTSRRRLSSIQLLSLLLVEVVGRLADTQLVQGKPSTSGSFLLQLYEGDLLLRTDHMRASKMTMALP